ncbi:RNA recognition motif domain [Macleaya cordata]|uniref:RNA recognition motif domain n=1 Tax=Macleaya cordata TaxID=56857 RepID=A0A200QCB3_MACCD|nr:RNA recognition motif domain [Macleaya cordata]
MATNSQHRCVFVGNIPYDATEEQLIQICEEVGPVVSFRLVIDRETGKPKGYGFCEYKDEETALSARRNLQGYEINGRQLRVDFAENDKGADRNREQGRGGPGLTSNVDPQKPLGGPAILGDSALHQPIGISLAATAASVMAGALGNAQTGSMSKQNGLQGQFGLGNDQLTHYLAKMSRNQLFEIMSEMKVMATQNKELARQLLLSSPQLPKALFQAQIMLGMVTPQVLQMPNIRQSPGSLLQPPSQEGAQDPKLAVFPPHPGQMSIIQNKTQLGPMLGVQEGQLSSVPQNILVNNQSSAVPFPQLSMQPRFQHSQQAQSQLLQQTTMAGQPGVSTVPSIRPFAGLPIRPQTPVLETSTALKQQVQPPLLQNRRPVGAVNLGHNTQLVFPNATAQDLLPPRPLLSQPNFQHSSSNSMMLPGVPETVNKLAERSAQVTDDARNTGYSNMSSGFLEQKRMIGDASDPMNHPSKLARLEDGRALRTMMSQNTSTTGGSGSTQIFGTGSSPANRISSSEGMQYPEKQVPQLAPDVESALLQQVMSLTPEQLSSLPLEQRQQVIQLQKMLGNK